MKGIVFTEFLEMVEDRFSPEIADKIIEASELSSGGAYTSVATYHHGELIELVTNLSKESEIDVPILVQAFGEYLMQRFVTMYPVFFMSAKDTFGFLEQVDNHVHVEVKKLYPDAELPRFFTERISDTQLKMEYSSQRPFAPLAEGLIRGCIAYYKETIDMQTTDLSNGKNNHVEFLLTKRFVE